MTQLTQITPISPSSPFNEQDFDAACLLLSQRGFRVMPLKDKQAAQLPYLSGNDQERLEELTSAMLDPAAEMVWTIRGGYGLTRILPYLSEQHRPKSPNFLPLGFSDSSALLLHLWKHYGTKGIHAPTLAKLPLESQESLEALWKILQGKATQIRYPTLSVLHHPQQGSITGTLVASNLCVLTHLIGTSSMPDFDNTILVLEEIGERPYRIDRMLTHLISAHALKGVKAIIVGHLTGCSDNGAVSEEAMEVFKERIKSLGIAILNGLPVGHESPNWPIPIGITACLQMDQSKAELQLLSEVC